MTQDDRPASAPLDYRRSQPQIAAAVAPQANPYKPLVIGFAVLIAVSAITAIVLNLRKDDGNKDYPKWYAAGQTMLKGGDLYTTGDGDTFKFMYPPSAAALLAPLTVAGPHVMSICLILGNSIAWVICVLTGAYLATGRALRQHPLLYVLPVVCSVSFIWTTYILGQPNLVLLACMLGAFAFLRQKKQWTAGALVALAAGIKAFPIAALVYLVYRRYWQAAISTVLCVVFLLLMLPAPVRGLAQSARDVRTWANGMLFHYDDKGIAQRTGRAYNWKNQSIVAVSNRLMRPVDSGLGKKRDVYINFVDLPFRAINLIILGEAGLLGLIYIWAMPRRAQRTPMSDAVEWAMLLLLILMTSPLSFGYFNTWLLYPIMVLTCLGLRAPADSRERSVLTGILVTFVALLALSLPIPWLRAAQAFGNVLIAQLMMFGVFAWTLRRGRKAAVEESPTLGGRVLAGGWHQ